MDAALIRERGLAFGIIVVKRAAMADDAVAAETRAALQCVLPGLPLVLASQDARGEFEYQGRADLVNFVASIDPEQIPWRRYLVGLNGQISIEEIEARMD